MKRLVYLIMLVLISSAGFGQKANFSGNWKINKEKSELGDQFSMAPNTIIVNHKRKSLEVEKHGDFQGEEYTTNDLFTLDGKECENPGWMESVKTSTAVWNKKTKVLNINSNILLEDGSDVEIIEEWGMNGDNLVIEVSASSSYGDMEERFVFDKQ